MSDADEYAKWIIANADKKGTPEFETVSNAYRDLVSKGVPTASDAPAEQLFLQKVVTDPIGTIKAGVTKDLKTLGNVGAGLAAGAGYAGSGFVLPGDVVNDLLHGKGLSLESNRARRHDIDMALSGAGADAGATGYGAGKLGGELLGAGGAGGLIAKGARATPGLAEAAPNVVRAIEGGGFIPGANTWKNLPARVLGGGISGGASSGLVNPDEAGLGTLLGGALPLAGKAGMWAGETARDIGRVAKAGLYDPLMNKKDIALGALERAVGDSNVFKDIQRAVTPGVKFSAGETTMNPTLLSIEKTLGKETKSALRDASDRNRAAVIAPLQAIAQTADAVAAQKLARENAVNDLYTQMKAKTFESDPEIAAILRTPAGERAVEMARTKMGNMQKPFNLEGTPTQYSPLVSKSGQPIQVAAATPSQYSGDALHELKLAFDHLMKGKPTTAAGESALYGVGDVRKAYNQWLTNKSPDYATARNTFAEMSAPMNQMQVAQALKERLVPSIMGETPTSLNATNLATALRHPDIVAQQGTGYNKALYNKIMSDEQRKTIAGLSKDASRIDQAKKRMTDLPSSPIEDDLIGQHMESVAPGMARTIGIVNKIPGVNYITSGVSALGGKLAETANVKIMKQLEEALANNPEEVLAALKGAQTRRQALSVAKSNDILANPNVQAFIRTLPVVATRPNQ